MISFIIPAYNEELYVRSSIASVHRSIKDKNLPYEIIVVNDSSSDSTAEVASEAGATVIEAECRQLGKVRNVGASHAKGDLLIFLDADTMVTKAVMSEVLDNMSEYKAGNAYGDYYDLDHTRFHRVMMRFYTWVCSRVWKVPYGYFIWCNADSFGTGFDEEYYLFEDVWFLKKFSKESFYFGKHRVLTSGRKAWTHNFLLRIVPLLVKVCIRGKKVLKSRSELSIWYDGVR